MPENSFYSVGWKLDEGWRPQSVFHLSNAIIEEKMINRLMGDDTSININL